MTNRTLQEVLSNKSQRKESIYNPTTKYTVNEESIEIPTWSHPQAVANRILNRIQHTKYCGVQVIAPPGSGKTTLAKIIAHHIHKKDDTFVVKLSKADAFKRLDNTIRTLEKRPTIYIFDDVSSVFAELTEAQIDKNFKTLTEVRWVLDPAGGNIPFIPILTYHYSKVHEKKFRSQNAITLFCDFGNEEKTNADTIAPKRTIARIALEGFEKIMDTQFDHHYFGLTASNGLQFRYKTDDPLRASCMIAGNIGSVIVTRKEDVCKKCDIKPVKKAVPETEIVEKVFTAYQRYGLTELLRICANLGVPNAIHPQAFNAKCFAEETVMTQYQFDPVKLAKACFVKLHKKPPKRTYRKRKLEDEMMQELDEISYDPDAEESKTLNDS